MDENFIGTYYLNDDKTYRPCTLREWGDQCYLMREQGTKHVASTQENGYWISTVWLGLDQAFYVGLPLLFETMIFQGDEPGEEIYCDRYSSWDDAVNGHQKALEWVRNRCKDE